MVEDKGKLVGLVTVKDVLHFTEQHHDEAEGHNGLSGAMDEGWTWLVDRWDQGLVWIQRRIRR
jgi:chloride channel 3/4/5